MPAPDTVPQYLYLLLNTKVHDRESFSCGESSLDEYLQRRASQDIKKRVAVVYVMTAEGDSSTIIGYYTLSSTALKLETIPPDIVKKFPAIQM